MSILLGSAVFHNPEMCTKKIVMTRPIQVILDDIEKVLKDHAVTVQRPLSSPVIYTVCRALWARDPSINIDNVNVMLPSYAPGRKDEWKAHPEAHKSMVMRDSPEEMEGGDVIQDGNRIFIGIGKRTNIQGVQWLMDHLDLSNKEIYLIPHTALHLDCCLCILPSKRLYYSKKYISKLPKALKKLYTISVVEKYLNKGVDPNLATNVMIIKNTLITTDQPKFQKLRNHWKKVGYDVVEIDFGNLWKYGGGIRCLTQWINNPGQTIC